MSEQVLGLSVNQVMAYTAIANVLMVVVLTAINVYYAGHAKRQADAAKAQVDASNRQSEIAAERLPAPADGPATPHRYYLRSRCSSRLPFTSLRTGSSASARTRFPASA